MKKGYSSEYKVKTDLISQYGRMNVIKVAIGGAQDFIIVEKGRLLKVIEVKECHRKRYYPNQRERVQFERIKTFCTEHGISGEVRIRYPNKPCAAQWEIKPINEELGVQ